MSNVIPTPPAWPGAPENQTPTPQSERTNTLALVAFIGSFFVSPLGIIAGHIALRQIKRSGEKGHGFALAATIIGYVSFVLTAIIIAVIVVVVSLGASHFQSEVRGLTHATQPQKAEGSQPSASGDYSDDFCHALYGIATSAQAVSKGSSQMDALKNAYAAVATVPSPHQKDYQAMADLLANPDSATADQVKTATTTLSKSAQVDALACAGRLK